MKVTERLIRICTMTLIVVVASMASLGLIFHSVAMVTLVTVIVASAFLAIMFIRRWNADSDRERQYEIENIGLRKQKTEMRQRINALLINLDGVAAYDPEVRDITESFRRLNNIQKENQTTVSK